MTRAKTQKKAKRSEDDIVEEYRRTGSTQYSEDESTPGLEKRIDQVNREQGLWIDAMTLADWKRVSRHLWGKGNQVPHGRGFAYKEDADFMFAIMGEPVLRKKLLGYLADEARAYASKSKPVSQG